MSMPRLAILASSHSDHSSRWLKETNLPIANANASIAGTFRQSSLTHVLFWVLLLPRQKRKEPKGTETTRNDPKRHETTRDRTYSFAAERVFREQGGRSLSRYKVVQFCLSSPFRCSHDAPPARPRDHRSHKSSRLSSHVDTLFLCGNIGLHSCRADYGVATFGSDPIAKPFARFSCY
jgi:hypothetical protein